MAETRERRKTWRYTNTVTWKDEKKGLLISQGKPGLQVATPPDFGGHEGIWSPEDLFVAAVNACIMTTFLYYRAKADIDLLSYSSTAEGTVEFGQKGLLFSRVEVKPVVRIASETHREQTEETMRQAERACLISSSINSAVVVEPQIDITDGPGPAV